jgi:hypothetical protein
MSIHEACQARETAIPKLASSATPQSCTKIGRIVPTAAEGPVLWTTEWSHSRKLQ